MKPEQPFVEIVIGDKHIRTHPGYTVMEALVAAGIMLRSDCGGRGRCGKCRVLAQGTEPGSLSEVEEIERKALGPDELAAGQRLACRARLLAGAAIEIPEESRLTPEVVQKGLPVLLAKLEALPSAKPARLPVRYGVAVDVGTTTIAVYLCDLRGRSIVSSTSARNPQAVFGDDVISRISAVRSEPEALPRLQTLAASAIDWAVAALCRQSRVAPATVEEIVAVGNSTMIHLLLGEDPSSIGVFPYTPSFRADQSRSAGSIGLTFNPGARLRTLPLVSGYLGADIISAALAADLARAAPGTLLADVGTNGEIILLSGTGLAATSCATGPAFEGAAIRHGMQATSGAVDSVRFNSATGGLDFTLIQRGPGPPKPPAGICGSGVINTVAELLRAGVITKSGSFSPENRSPRLRPGENGALEFEIVPAGAQGGRRAISLTQADVRAVQLAKGALRTGIDLLCRENGLDRPRHILLAGAFGSFISRADALTIGMFPPLGADGIEVVGNAAGAGAVLALLEEGHFERARAMAGSVRVLDLAAHPDFQETFIRSLSF